MISINKINEVNFLDNNTTFLITTSTQIIINKGNQSIVIFDFSLVKKDEIFFPEEDLDIYSVFKKFSCDEFLFYCPESQCLIHVNLQKKSASTISLETSFDSIVLAPLYLWENNKLVISDYKENFYTIYPEDKRIITERKSEIIKKNSFFYDFCQAIFSKQTQTIYSASYQYIFKDESNKTLNFVDFLNKQQVSIINEYPKAHDYEYRNGTFLIISENDLTVFSTINMESIKIKPEKSYIFLRAAFLDDYSFVVLSSYQNKNKLVCYTIG